VGLRDKIMTLEELNRSEVVNIEVKYKDIQKKDTSDLISGHVHEIKTLIAEIDKLNWLLREKNQEIQNLIRDKKEQKAQEEERELAFRAEIDTLKNKLDLQEERATSEGQELNRRINSLADKLHRDSESYSQRVSQLSNTINSLEGELKSQQNELDRTRNENSIKSKQAQKNLEEVTAKLEKTQRALSDAKQDLSSYQRQAEEQQAEANARIAALSKQNKELETSLEEVTEKLERHADHSGDQERILRLEIEALKKNVSILENGLSEEQQRHSREMEELSANLRAKLEKLQAQHKKTIAEHQQSSANELAVLNSRLEKALRDREEANKKVAEYSGMYSHVEKYFKNPAEGSIFRERGEGSILEALGRTQESTINIF
jgi:DNA repair exonuclease SbcCD ATPase subunit